MRWSEAVLGLIGLWLALAPDAWGWKPLASVVGETRMLRFFLGFAILFVAWLVAVKVRLVTDMRDLVRALRRERFGESDTKREAIDILLRAASSPRPDVSRTAFENLERLTGQSFGADLAAWRRWWDAHRDSFAADRGNGGARPSGTGGAEGGG
jgi:hypothetical protein